MCQKSFGGIEQSSKQITRLISRAILNEDNYDVDVFIKCSSLFIKGFDAQSYSSARKAIEERQKERQKDRKSERQNERQKERKTD